ncbi:hypothetical protein [Burkholderia phage FLC9]|nr:hypothetical protein [Burkholderia phage FLC9]
MSLDLNKPATQIIIDLIWRSNGISFEYDTLDFGVPKAIDNPPPWAANTVVEITDNLMESDLYSGSTKIAYRRLPLSELVPYSTDPIPLPAFPFQTTDVLAAINAAYQIQLQPSDVVNETYQSLEGPFTVVAADTALCYIGSLTPNILVGLDEVVPQPNLGGFTPYEPS